MKVRDGFVSNSSSTSFLIGINRVEDPKLFKLLETWCERECHYETCMIASGKQDILNLFAKDHPYEYANVEEIKEYSDDTWDFVYIDISYHDDVIEHFLEKSSAKIFFCDI
jgi:hypothetical protein